MCQPIWANSCADLFSDAPYIQRIDKLQFDAPKDFLKSALNMFKGPEPQSFEWLGQVLSTAQIKNLAKFAKKAGKPLQKNSKIRVIQIEEMKEVVESNVGPQTVHRNGAFEQQIIEKSLIDSKPQEVLKIRLHLYDARIVETPIMVTGNARYVDFSKAEFELYSFLKGQMGSVEKIEFAHSHPSYVVSVQSEQGSSFRANEISTGDVRALVDFSSRVPHGKSIIIKAIVPNGFYYQMIIPSGIGR